MTTTLRPTAPELRTEDGGRSRPYEVCVNSRPVGSLTIATDPRFGPRFGRIAGLVVDERDRHRGRGTVAALAAEEVLRGWGCTQVSVDVPAVATTALGLAGALGYVERSRSLNKPLAAPPALPPGSTARPLAEEEFAAWHAAGRAQYVAEWAGRGVPAELAAAKADRDRARLLPHGAGTPGVVLRVLRHEGADVGTLWLALREEEAYVFEVRVAAAHRGRGHGRTLMHLAEREALAAGGRAIALSVFAGNTPALRLYESLGYRATEFHLYKILH
ncbi:MULTISPECIES: GNAT family N-acetyltransferase [Streptomyces]|uniref:GNAT family N-acetyltransferase n=1 Tax=Streptomyces TaxID=1883 RepID=UPI0031D7CA65